MPVVLDLGPVGDGEAEVGEDLGEFVHDLGDRVDGPGGSGGDGERQVEALRRQPGVEGLRFEFGLARGNGGCDRLAQGIEARPLDQPCVGGHAAERLHQRRHRPRLAERGDTDCIEPGEVGRGGDGGEQAGFECGGVGHGSP